MDIRLKYFFIGTLFGLLFPLGAFIFELQRLDLTWNFHNIRFIHSNNLILYMIDTAPLFLGLFALLGGISKVRSVHLIARFEHVSQLLNRKIKQVRSDTTHIFTHLNETIGNLKTDHATLSDIYFQSNHEITTTIETAKQIAEKITAVKVTMSQLFENHAMIDHQNNETKKYLEKYLNGFRDLKSHIDFLEEFSRQIEMLAVNSSIEANRIGKEAKSFLVFADTIHRLVQGTKTRNTEVLKMVGILSVDTEQLAKILTEESQRIEDMKVLNNQIMEMTATFDTLNVQFIDHLKDITHQLKEQNIHGEAFDHTLDEMTSASRNMLQQLQDLVGNQITIIQQMKNVH